MRRFAGDTHVPFHCKAIDLSCNGKRTRVVVRGVVVVVVQVVRKMPFVVKESLFDGQGT